MVDEYTRSSRLEPNTKCKSSYTIWIVLLIEVFFATEAGATGYLCGTRTYFPAQTGFTAFVEDPEIFSEFTLTLNESITAQKTQTSQEVNKSILGRFIVDAIDVTKATGDIVFKKSGTLNIKDIKNNEYYFLEHAKKQTITVVEVNPEGKDVEVELLYLPLEQKTAKPAAKKNDEIINTMLPPGARISIPTAHLRKFNFKLNEGKYLYKTVDPGNRAKLEILDTLRISPNGTFKVELRNLRTDFSRRAFVACARPSDRTLGREFFQITDIEILESNVGKARLALSLPEPLHNINGFRISSFATPIELRIISTKGETVGQAPEVILAERTYYIGSPKWSFIIALSIAFLAYFIPLGFVRAQRQTTTSKVGVNFGQFTLVRNKQLRETGEENTAVVPLKSNPPAWFSPLWLGRARRGGASLSSFQIAIWTYLVFFVATYVFLLNGQLIDIPNHILILLGISGAGSVAAKVTTNRQDERAEIITTARSNKGEDEILKQQYFPAWSDLIMTRGRVELARLQMLVFTLLAAAYVGITAMVTFQFPVIPEGLLWLMGISNGLYVLGKAAEPSLADKLAQADLQCRKAVRERESAETKLVQAKGKLDNQNKELAIIEEQLKKTTVDADKERLQKQIEEQKEKIKVSQDELNIANNELENLKKKETTMDQQYKEILNKLNQAIEKES